MLRFTTEPLTTDEAIDALFLILESDPHLFHPKLVTMFRGSVERLGLGDLPELARRMTHAIGITAYSVPASASLLPHILPYESEEQPIVVWEYNNTRYVELCLVRDRAIIKIAHGASRKLESWICSSQLQVWRALSSKEGVVSVR